MKHRKQPQEHSLVVEHNGTRHEAKYTADKGALIVYYGTATIRGTYGRLLAQDEARLLFLEFLLSKDSVATAKTGAGENKET